MAETEKQEGQKTVVAFIAGLLIGGLLVWVFSSSPETTPAETNMDTTDGETASEETSNTNTGARSTNADSSTRATDLKEDESGAASANIIREGALTVSDQPAGSVVVLNVTTFPTNAGWIVVRDYAGGVSGSILGAARYNETEGLVPQSVNLLRATESGSTYQVVYFSENGDRVFDLSDDFELEGVSATFTAE